MDQELKTLWCQFAGWAAAINDMATRHFNGEPCEDIRDHRLPREHIDRLLKDLDQIYYDIRQKEPI